MTTRTTLIESRTNRLGIEVRHETTPDGGQFLRAYRNGRCAAQQRIIRYRTGRVVDLNVVYADDAPATLHGELALALAEGVRVLRDGRGLCEVA